MRKIVALSLAFPGVTSLMRNGEAIGLWKFIQISHPVACHVGPFTPKLPKAKIYLFGAWNDYYNTLLDELPGKKMVLWTSSAGEVGLEPVEISYLSKIVADKRIEKILFINELAKAFNKGIYLPLPVKVKPKPKNIEKKDIVTLFCPSTMKKNVFTQLVAVKLLQKDIPNIVLHTNLRAYRQVMTWLGLKHVWHDWLPEKEYHELLASAKINLAVSWAESFNYQVLEAALLGTPSVVSPAVKSMDIQDLVVENPNSPIEIKEKIKETLKNPAFEDMVRKRAIEIAEENNKEAKKVIEKLK